MNSYQLNKNISRGIKTTDTNEMTQQADVRLQTCCKHKNAIYEMQWLCHPPFWSAGLGHIILK